MPRACAKLVGDGEFACGATQEGPTVGLDPLSLAGIAEPYSVLARIRRDSPVSPTPAGTWNITRYDDCVQVLRNTDVFSSDLRVGGGPRSKPQTFILGASDTPEHDRLRATVASTFTATSARQRKEAIRAHVDRLVKAFTGKGHVDLVKDVGRPLSITVVGELLGVPPEQQADVARWSEAVTRLGHLQELRTAAGGLDTPSGRFRPGGWAGRSLGTRRRDGTDPHRAATRRTDSRPPPRSSAISGVVNPRGPHNLANSAGSVSDLNTRSGRVQNPASSSTHSPGGPFITGLSHRGTGAEGSRAGISPAAVSTLSCPRQRIL